MLEDAVSNLIWTICERNGSAGAFSILFRRTRPQTPFRGGLAGTVGRPFPPQFRPPSCSFDTAVIPTLVYRFSDQTCCIISDNWTVRRAVEARLQVPSPAAGELLTCIGPPSP